MTTFAIPPRWWITAAALIVSAILLSPFYWVLVGSFMTPAELASSLRAAGLRVRQTTGLVPSPLTGQWHTSRDMSVNYMIAAVR